MCPDFAAEHADISTGGIGAFNDWTLTIVRTDLGREIMEGLLAEGMIEVRPGDDDPGAIALMHKLAKKSRHAGRSSRSRSRGSSGPDRRVGRPEAASASAGVGKALPPFGDDFVDVEALSGIVVLLGCGRWRSCGRTSTPPRTPTVWHHHLDLSFGPFDLDLSRAHWVTDGLMTIFFFVVGLEIKREVVRGELRDRTHRGAAGGRRDRRDGGPRRCSTSRSTRVSRPPRAGPSRWPPTSRSPSACSRSSARRVPALASSSSCSRSRSSTTSARSSSSRSSTRTGIDVRLARGRRRRRRLHRADAAPRGRRHPGAYVIPGVRAVAVRRPVGRARHDRRRRARAAHARHARSAASR